MSRSLHVNRTHTDAVLKAKSDALVAAIVVMPWPSRREAIPCVRSTQSETEGLEPLASGRLVRAAQSRHGRSRRTSWRHPLVHSAGARPSATHAASPARLASRRQMSSVSGGTTNVDRRGSGSRRGAAEVACCAGRADAGAAPGGCCLFAVDASRVCAGEDTIDGGCGARVTARPSRERFAVVRGVSFAVSSRTRRRYVRRAATETGTPRSESIEATAVQL